MLERQVRYSIQEIECKEKHLVTFMIINVPLEVLKIKDRIYAYFELDGNIQELYNERIDHSDGKKCSFISFFSQKNEIDERKIYRGKLEKDNTLHIETQADAERYLLNILY
jgi:hypothetical protein